MRTDLSTNPKVVAIAELLNLDEDTVVGKMHRLWSWADKHAKDGRALGTPAWLDRMMKCKGLSAALMREEIDWLQFEGGTLVFPRWDEHNSQSAKTRALAMRRMKEVRAKENADRTDVAPDTNTSATESEQPRNQSATRGDKRRGDKKIPPPPTPAATGPRPAASVSDAGGGGGGVPVSASGSDPVRAPSPGGLRLGEVAASAGEGSVSTGLAPASSAPSSPIAHCRLPTARSPQATALLDTLIGSGVWSSVAESAIDQAGVELVGAVVAEWQKLPKPTPELLGHRLGELTKPGSDIRKAAEAYIAKIAQRRQRAMGNGQRAIGEAGGSATEPAAARTSTVRVGDLIDAGRGPLAPCRAPVEHVPGITDHPAFRSLASDGREGEDARLRVDTSAAGCGVKTGVQA